MCSEFYLGTCPFLSQNRQLQALTPWRDGRMDDVTHWTRRPYQFLLQTKWFSVLFLSMWLNFSTIITTEIKRQTGRPTEDPKPLGLIWLAFFFYGDNLGDSPCTWCLRILIYPISALWVAVNHKTHKCYPVFGMRMITIFVCHQYWSHWNPVKDKEDSLISSVHLWIS